jgi:hypothetical protein
MAHVNCKKNGSLKCGISERNSHAETQRRRRSEDDGRNGRHRRAWTGMDGMDGQDGDDEDDGGETATLTPALSRPTGEGVDWSGFSYPAKPSCTWSCSRKESGGVLPDWSTWALRIVKCGQGGALKLRRNLRGFKAI